MQENNREMSQMVRPSDEMSRRTHTENSARYDLGNTKEKREVKPMAERCV